MDGWEGGAKLFNGGEYWEAHEAWEPLWMKAEGLDKSLYAGVILLAAALHKAHGMGNAHGGRRNYAKALAHLAYLPSTFAGVAVRRLEAEVHAALRDASLRPQLPLEVPARRKQPVKTYIVLLRGVMPTGKNKVLMAPLRGALEGAGLGGARTYIQSSNIVVATDLPQTELETLIHEVIRDAFGGDIKVLARPADAFKEALERCPFKDADTTRLYFTLLAAEPDSTLLREFLAPGYAPDEVEVIGDVVYTLYALRYSEGKINNAVLERKLKVSATTRVYRTIAKLIELSEAQG